MTERTRTEPDCIGPAHEWRSVGIAAAIVVERCPNCGAERETRIYSVEGCEDQSYRIPKEKRA